MSFYRTEDLPTDIRAEYRPFCKECDWIGYRTADLNFAQAQATHHDKNHAFYDCPWHCPINIYRDEADYHREWHRNAGEDPDVRGGKVAK